MRSFHKDVVWGFKWKFPKCLEYMMVLCLLPRKTMFATAAWVMLLLSLLGVPRTGGSTAFQWPEYYLASTSIDICGTAGSHSVLQHTCNEQCIEMSLWHTGVVLRDFYANLHANFQAHFLSCWVDLIFLNLKFTLKQSRKYMVHICPLLSCFPLSISYCKEVHLLQLMNLYWSFKILV